ncbi:hypothetical protein MVG78_14715 [Roseomonas gilardii subsp. gilardii]|uniref:hypothetical protein n=1 Tax=Roseomonas gilardii TaxID=257708 RepID=UPI001FF73853|nr:hypothetical protein [Roseomonas gilardii]UPG71784.1 hypothetical protein MVG78_14715 [Roseomonas gilardii subsp. gilardii]
MSRVEGLNIRHSPASGLLQIGLRLAGPLPSGAVQGQLRGLPPLANAAVEIFPAPGGETRIEATAVLPPGLGPESVRLLLSSDEEPLLSLTPLPATPERAGLATLEPMEGGGAVVRAWAEPGLRPGLWADHRAEPLRPAGGGLWQARLPEAPVRLAVTLGPDRGLVTNPLSAWLAPHPGSDPRLDTLRGRHAGQVAWLIGNGPSVRPEELDRLQGRLTVAFNRFHLARDSMLFRPTYTLSGDGQVIGDFGAEIVGEAGGPVFLAAETRPDLPGDWIWLRQAAVWPTLFSLDPRRVVGAGGSSLFAAFQLLWWMGVRRFVIYGADFHFEGAEPGGDGLAHAEGNHFIPGYRGGKGWIPPAWRDICTGFLLARHLAEAEGGWVRNATHGGQLEIFPRTCFEDALRLR